MAETEDIDIHIETRKFASWHPNAILSWTYITDVTSNPEVTADDAGTNERVRLRLSSIQR
jgi:hypothetical protein